MSKFSFFKKDTTLGQILKDSNRNKNFLENNRNILQRSSDFFKEVFSFSKIDEKIKEHLEEAFLALDFGPYLSEKLSKSVASKVGKNKSLKDLIREDLLEEYGEYDSSVRVDSNGTNVLLIVGPNGSGKTTTIAKLAYVYKELGHKVLVVAGDTFRTGAVEQLIAWTEELGVDIVSPTKKNEDPSALIYRAIDSNKDGKYSVIICDTSGRQHNNDNLLRELSKIYRTIRKFDASYPQETLLVIDANNGQSGLIQAHNFFRASEVSGLIITKMDSMTRGGIIFSIKSTLNIPVKFIGVGETKDTLIPFNMESIVDCWLENIDI